MQDYYDFPFIKRREYSKIFTGTNQNDGYENIYLSFAASTKEIVFSTSKVQFFHYSTFGPAISIHNADLIRDGATAGSSPNRADKIYKKQANYNKYTGWGNSLGAQTGTWLCAWLSGDYTPTTTPIWMDRYYNPGYISFTDALSAQEEIYTVNIPIIYDTLSSLTFDPGVLYMYHHFGDTENQSIVDSLSGNDTNTYLTLSFKDWETDQSTFNNIGFLSIPSAVNTEVINDVSTSVLSLSEDIDAQFKINYSDNYNSLDHITVSSWIKVDDWNQVKGNQIFGNYFRGGWGLIYETGFFNPMLTIFENYSGHLLIGNHIGKFTYDKKLLPFNPTTETTILSSVAVSQDLYIWAISNSSTSKRLFKIDYNGEIINTIQFPLSANLTDLTLDYNNGVSNVYVMNAAGPVVYKYNPDTLQLLSSSSRGSGHTKIVIDNRNTLRSTNRLGITVDRNNKQWTLTGPVSSSFNILKDSISVLVLSGYDTFHSVQTDPQNYIWALFDNQKFVKINSVTNTIALTGTIGYVDLPGSREIGFSKEYKNGEYIDYAWVLQAAERKLYKLDLNGNQKDVIDMSNKLDINKYPVVNKEDLIFAVKGDFIGTQLSSKFIYPQNIGKKILQFNIKFIDPLGNLIERKLKYDISTLANKQWHMFTFTYTSDTGKVTIYNNGIPIPQIVTGPYTNFNYVPIGSKIYMKYKNDLVFGGNSGRFTSLDEELQLDQFHFNGSLADPFIYNKALSTSDIAHIYKQKFNAKPLIWNSPIGKQVFIEEIEKFFLHKLPGSKSNFYNIKLTGLNITNTDLRSSIEEIIRDTVKRVAPAQTELLNVLWQ